MGYQTRSPKTFQGSIPRSHSQSRPRKCRLRTNCPLRGSSCVHLRIIRRCPKAAQDRSEQHRLWLPSCRPVLRLINNLKQTTASAVNSRTFLRRRSSKSPLSTFSQSTENKNTCYWTALLEVDCTIRSTFRACLSANSDLSLAFFAWAQVSWQRGESSARGHRELQEQVQVSGVRKKITCSKLSLLVIRTPLRTPERRAEFIPLLGAEAVAGQQRTGQHTTIKLAASNSTSIFGVLFWRSSFLRYPLLFHGNDGSKVTKVPSLVENSSTRKLPTLMSKNWKRRCTFLGAGWGRLGQLYGMEGAGQPSSACLDSGQFAVRPYSRSHVAKWPKFSSPRGRGGQVATAGLRRTSSGPAEGGEYSHQPEQVFYSPRTDLGKGFG